MKHGTLVLLALLGGIVFIESLERAHLKIEAAPAAPQMGEVPPAPAVTGPGIPKAPAPPDATTPQTLTEVETLTLNGHTRATLADAGPTVDG